MQKLGNRCLMFCRATKPRLPLATGAAVSSPKTFPRTITTSVGVEKESADGVSNVLPAASRRFKNTEKQTAYDSLLSVLDFDKGGDVRDYWSVLNVSPVDRTVTYRLRYGERTLVTAYLPDDEVEDEDDEVGVQLVVCNLKENSFRLGFGVRAFDREIIIDHVAFARHERARDQHVFNFRKDFDGDRQAAWYEYLKVRGIKPGYDLQKRTIRSDFKIYGESRS